MHAARRLALVVALAAIALAALATSASASTQSAAGTFVEGPENIAEERESGGNLHLRITREVLLTGTYSGVGQADERLVIHADGSTNLHATIEFVGTACGKPVTLTFLLEGQGSLVDNVIAGSYTIIRGGDRESGVGRGHGRFIGTAGGAGAYEGKVHCD
jgi:hypothetical protein